MVYFLIVNAFNIVTHKTIKATLYFENLFKCFMTYDFNK